MNYVYLHLDYRNNDDNSLRLLTKLVLL